MKLRAKNITRPPQPREHKKEEETRPKQSRRGKSSYRKLRMGMRHRGNSGPRSQVLAGEACHPEEILFETGFYFWGSGRCLPPKTQHEQELEHERLKSFLLGVSPPGSQSTAAGGQLYSEASRKPESEQSEVTAMHCWRWRQGGLLGTLGP